MKLLKKTTATLLIAVFMISVFAVVIPVSAGYGKPTIDGVISTGEWDGATTFGGTDYNVYVLNDEDFLYVAFEAEGGDFIAYPGMTNIYIYAGDDWAGECWAYTALGQDEIEGLTYFTTHHIQPPKVKEGQESRTTSAIVEANTLVMEWQIPLSEMPMGLGDTMAFDFMSFSEGSSAWSTAWLYEQEYTLEIPPKCRAIATGTPDDIYWYGVKYSSGDYPDLHATVHITRSGQAGFTVHSDSIPMHITATFEVVFVGEEQTVYGPRWVFESVGPVNIRVDSIAGGGYTVGDIGQVRVYLTYGEHGTVSIGPFSDGQQILKVTNVPLVNFKQW